MPGRPFREVRDEMFRLYAEHRYLEALALVRRESPGFPDRWGDTLYWIGCLAAATGDQPRALHALREAVERGHWWSEGMLCGDPDLRSLQGHQEFDTLVAVCKKRQAEAEEQSSPRLLTLRPTSRPPHPLLITLHGQGGNAEEFAEYWHPAVEGGWLVAVPQSSRMNAPGRFEWSDRDRARDEMREHYAALAREHAIDLSRVILAGFSQGGAVAIWLAARGVIPARGFLGVACAARDLDEIRASVKARPSLRGHLIVGTKDYVYDRARELADLLRSLAIAVELEAPEGWGHDIPVDFDRRLGRALEFLVRAPRSC